MVCIRNTGRYFVLGFILAALSGIMVFGFTQAVSAQERGPGQPAVSAPRSHHIPSHRDSRYNHNRAYPARGHYVGAVPRGHYSVYHGGVRYRYYGVSGTVRMVRALLLLRLRSVL